MDSTIERFTDRPICGPPWESLFRRSQAPPGRLNAIDWTGPGVEHSSQLLKGVLDMVLLALIAEEPSYGYEMVDKLQHKGLELVSESENRVRLQWDVSF